MLYYDLKNGIVNRWRWLLLPMAFWFLAVCNISIYAIDRDDMTFGGCLFAVLAGNEPMNIFDRSFSVPVLWLFIQLGYCFFTIEYPTRDMNIFGQQVMVRCGRKYRWVISKCIWTATSALIYWGVGWLMLGVFCIFNKVPLSMSISGELPPSILASCDIYTSSCTASQSVFILMVMPVLVSVAVCLIQLMTAIVSNEIFALSISLFISVWSMCIRTPIAVSNYAMMERCNLFNTKGLEFERGILILLFVISASVALSLLLFKRCDILEPKKNGE